MLYQSLGRYTALAMARRHPVLFARIRWAR